MRSSKPDVQILHRDDDLLAINKPPGMPSVPAQGKGVSAIRYVAETLNLKYKGEADPRVRPVHRIDLDTSGILLFALSRPAQQHISHQFQNNAIGKEYLALVAGQMRDDEGEIDAPLEPITLNHIAQMRIARRQGKPARTRYKVEQRFRIATLVRVFPQTGKMHQIRVHLAHIGHPLTIDPIYNPHNTDQSIRLSQFKRGYRPKRDEEERPMMSRLTLHAHRLSFEHPNGTSMTLEADLPKDFRVLLTNLEKYGK